MKSLIKIGQIFGVWEVIGSSTENKRNLYLAKCGCGNIKQYPATVLRKLAKKSNCICSYQTNAIKEIGNKYNRLTIIEIDINKRLRNNHIHYICKCDCGNISSVTRGRLLSGYTKSCGCLAAEISSKSKQRNGRNPAFNSVVASYKQAAYKRNIGWNLSDEEVITIFSENCYYCNNKDSNLKIQGKWEFKYNGIDRLNPEKGYSIDNVKACCKSCNMRKWDSSEKEFYKWIEQTYKYLISIGRINLNANI